MKAHPRTERESNLRLEKVASARRRGEVRLAEALIGEALQAEIAPYDETRALTMLAYVRLDQGRVLEAVEICTDLIGAWPVTSPQWSNAMAARGGISYRAESWVQAASDLRSALVLGTKVPVFDTAATLVSTWCECPGVLPESEARSWLRVARRSVPPTRLGRSQMAWVEASVERQLGSKLRAVDLLERVVSALSREGEDFYTALAVLDLVRCNLELGCVAEAVRNLGTTMSLTRSVELPRTFRRDLVRMHRAASKAASAAALLPLAMSAARRARFVQW